MSTMLLSNDRTRSAEYATAEDFQRLFASEMKDLFHLALLLTADAEDAECCVIFAIRDCMAVDSVSKAWTRTWARRAVVRNAIRIAAGLHKKPQIGNSDSECALPIVESRRGTSGIMVESAGILTLDSFERLVYVICVVEQYPIRDCALLLGKSLQDVLNARNRAMDQVAAFEQGARREASCSTPTLCSVMGSKQKELDQSCGTLLD